MSPTIEEQIERLKCTIAEMEAQRDALGETVVQKAVDPLREKLEQLNRLLEASQASVPDKPTQQRKLVTLLFMDIVGSTSIAQHMDPEDVGDIFDATLKQLAQPVTEHGGHVTRFMGDGFLSIFGAPTAREDDPEQAVRAGLKIIELSSELATQLQTEWGIHALQVRVGINTGMVRLGGETEAADTLMGAVVNLASRLESAAPPGGLLISHDTYRQIRGVFDVELLPPIQVKGFDEPVQVYRILRAKPRTFRSYTRGVEGVETRMVGRETELKYLQDALLTAIEENKGQMVTISGEAGVGKSRLLYEFQNWIELLPPPYVRFFEGRAHQEAQAMPYALLRDLFEFRFQIQEDDSPESARAKIENGFQEAFAEGGEGQMRAHILGQLLGYDFSLSPHLKGVLGDAEQLRNRGLMYLSEYFKGLCIQSPVVVLLEDIHWADDSSLDALSWLGERMQRLALLIAGAARPTLYERRPFWGEGLEYHHCLELEPLSRRESRQLVAEILKLADQVPSELFELVVEGAEGNPFYVEELVKMLVEDGVIVKGEDAWQIHPERLEEIEVPPTLAGVLQARLDSLPDEERIVLQQASVVGRLFWDRVVAHIQAAEGGRPQVVPEALTSLRGKEMVYRREASTFIDAGEYLFKHDILREVTYESVLKRLRRRYHGLVADWLIAQVAERAGEFSGLIAGHLLLAGRQEQAGEYFLQAGQAALASYANAEAEVHFRKALDLSSKERPRAACLAGLGESLRLQGRQEEAEQPLHQAIDLYHQMGEDDRVAYLCTLLSMVLWMRDYQKAWDACQEGLRWLTGTADCPGLAYLLAEAGRIAHFSVQPKEEVVSLCSQAIAMSERLGILEPKAGASITLALARDEPQTDIALLQDIAVLCEAHGLLSTAARAHLNMGAYNEELLGGAEQSFQHFMKTAEIGRRMGDVNSILWGLTGAIDNWVNFENLGDIQDHAAAFLHKSSASESQVNYCLLHAHAVVSSQKGEWMQDLEYRRERLRKLHKGGDLQIIANVNVWLALDILELNRFTGQDYLAEAEAALMENVAIQWFDTTSQILLVNISVRKDLIHEAHERLDEIPKVRLHRLQESHRLDAEIELAMAEGHWDQAMVTCQTLIEIYQPGGYRWHWARRLIDLGDILLGRNKPGDRQRAEEVYHQSLEMFTEMGATGYIQVLEERLGGM